MVGNIKDQFFTYFSQENSWIIFEKFNQTLIKIAKISKTFNLGTQITDAQNQYIDLKN